ncbi:MAG: hypothetical protein JO040_13675 [Gemmatimonadetes bacterium]|nr:hypothetical protein [Gemmatimonadota bacterium]
MTDDLDGIPAFVAVAEAKGFRAAGSPPPPERARALHDLFFGAPRE